MCSAGSCLAFLIAQVVFLMNYSEQQTTAIMENGATFETEINVDEVMKKFVIEFYTKRFVDGQNIVVAPLTIYRVFMSLYGSMDASAKFDLHSLADIPQDVSPEKMTEIEHYVRNHTLPVGDKLSLAETRLYFDKSVGKARSDFGTNNLKPIATRLTEKQAFCQQVNDWIRNPPVNGTDDLVHDYDLNNETQAFIVGALSIDWDTQLHPSSDDKRFQGETVKYLEGSISTGYAKLENLKAEVVELTNDRLVGVKLWIIMPDKASSIKEFNDQLSVESIRQIERGLTGQKVDVKLALPMVTIEYNSQEDAYVMEVFEVFSSLFTKPSVKLVDGKDDLYSIKNFLMKCILRVVGEDTAKSKAQTTTGAAAVTFDRPFVLMILSKDGSVPLLMANYFSPTDKLRALEAMERRMKAAAKEHMDL
ncbi:uncharacterized protein LOC134205814 [Armigeres subalbatus]|uniref:uncharacterized protein LOC134205814 n=1 Tax=Armigeres subalbatus TaxID=124917 RepID=UPI002ED60AD9